MRFDWPSSFRYRLLVPVLSSALLAASAVGIVSSFLGQSWAQRDVRKRFDALEETLARANFPLTENVIQSLATLSGCELVTVVDSLVEQSSLGIDPDTLQERISQSDFLNETMQIGGEEYLHLRTQVPGSRSQGAVQVEILFPMSVIHANGRRAALLPLLTGCSTIFALTLVILWIANHTALRITRLQQRVSRIAEGDFDVRCDECVSDEIGALGASVDSMASQLKELWGEVRKKQSAEWLHLVANGLAHQLRNTLTGCKLAIELHSRELDSPSEEVQVAFQQLRIAEEYVKRLLLVDGEQQEPATERNVRAALEDIWASMSPVASHRRSELSWDMDARLAGLIVEDAAALHTAITNLVWNALDAGAQIRVRCECNDASRTRRPVNELRILVEDNGPGIDQGLHADPFEPFVSTKPEGMGLGLPLVKQSAERLGGEVEYRRDLEWTTFEFRCPVHKQKEAPQSFSCALPSRS